MKKRVLYIGSLFPQVSVSAAGLRSLNIIESFQKHKYNVYFMTGGKMETQDAKEVMKMVGGEQYVKQCSPHSTKEINEYVQTIKPDVVIYDRFITEEKYSWMIHKTLPNALTVLDTQDLHFLRKGRKAMLESILSNPSNTNSKILAFEQVINYGFNLENYNSNSDAFREVCSMFRSDLTLLISDYETQMLLSNPSLYPHLSSKLYTFAFCYKDHHSNRDHLCNSDRDCTGGDLKSKFQRKKNYFMLGNFGHSPNLDSFQILTRKLWPKIFEQFKNIQNKNNNDTELLPELHIYGANPSKEHLEYTDKSINIYVKGAIPRGEDALQKTLEEYRVHLAPLRYGAGIKGKICDGWRAETPVITTAIGAEGMKMSQMSQNNNATKGEEEQGEPVWGGKIVKTEDEFVQQAIRLYQNETVWNECTTQGKKILQHRFGESNGEQLVSKIDSILQSKQAQPNNAENNNNNNNNNKSTITKKEDWMQQMMWFSHNRSNEYFSRWVALKEANKHKT